MIVNRAKAVDVATAEAPDLPPGYKRTDVGVIPEDWDCSRIGDLTTRVGSGITPTGGKRVYVTDGRPFLRSQNVGWGILNLHDLAFITDEIHALFDASEIKEGDVLLNITGASIGRSAVADIAVARGNVNQHVCEIRPDPKQLSSEFLNSYLLSAAGQRQIDNFQAGGNRQGLNYSQIRSFLIPRPCLREQRAIAEALSDADGLLGALEALIAKKRAIKQAAMQQLLTGKTRLPGFSGEWETTSMGRIGSTYSGLSGKGKPDFGIGDAHYVTFLNILENVVLNSEQFENVRVAPGESQNRVLKGDLLFNGTSETPGDLAMGAVMAEQEENLYLNSFCFGFRIHDQSKYHPLFLAYFFRGITGRAIMCVLAQGATRYNMSKSQFLTLKLSIPNVEEQTAIAAVLSDLDTEITMLERQQHKTRAIKQGMMQQLLTGRVRLVGVSGSE